MTDPETTFGRNVRKLREAHGLSQAEFGRRLAAFGFPMLQSTVTKLEAGRRPIRVNEGGAIAAFFDVPLRQLLGEHGLDGITVPPPSLQEQKVEELHRLVTQARMVHDALGRALAFFDDQEGEA